MIKICLKRGFKTLVMISYTIVQKQFIRQLVSNSSNRSFSCTSILFESSSKSLYDDLGLDPNASSQDIKNAFIRISKEVHPDKNPDNPEAAAKFFEISNAYNTLSNAKRRRAYDRGQLGQSSIISWIEFTRTFKILCCC